ncbi:MAG: hypothetical protein WBP38_01515 [Hyphomicrobium sp.]|nr:hypothetical protein [Hyphomicrobium sp.]
MIVAMMLCVIVRLRVIVLSMIVMLGVVVRCGAAYAIGYTGPRKRIGSGRKAKPVTASDNRNEGPNDQLAHVSRHRFHRPLFAESVKARLRTNRKHRNESLKIGPNSAKPPQQGV